MRECTVDGLNSLCVGKCKNVQSQQRRDQKEEVRGLRESLGLEPQFEEWKNWPWAYRRIPEKQLPLTSSRPDVHGLF